MEKTLKFNSQVCTNRFQSERLLALGIKKETADMCWTKMAAIRGTFYVPELAPTSMVSWRHTPAWSLHRLWELIPKVVLKNPALHLTMCSNSIFYCTEDNNEDYEKPFSAKLNLYDNIIDSIEWLIKEGYFPKEYLV